MQQKVKFFDYISMSNNKAIEIILRIRPHPKPSPTIKLEQEKNEITFTIAKDESQGYINNQKQSVKFKFDQIFDMDTRQEKLFDKVAKEVVDSAIDGFNGTIFAYGQTGSGKTFTMTGNAEAEDSQGIIPRTLNYIYYAAEVKGVQVKVKIRYMQIYNGTGYDLLDPSIDMDSVDKLKTLEELQKVKPMDTENGLKLQNLSTHLANTFEDAMGILLVGDTNRITCKTPKNDESTRSHCIFMINLETSRPGSEVKSVATINLVDLSGSERIKQTKVEGLLEKEAISINLGLHYLERMIVELNKKMNGQNVHIPYRESLMNLILRDSIGGNCITRMVATMSPKAEDMLESIATCKFAQRVALIKNNIQRNETVDPAIIIAGLKRENAQLRAQLALLKGEDLKQQLDKWEIEDCHKAAQAYLESPDPNATLIMSDRLKLNQCFYYLKSVIKKGGISAPINANKSKAGTQNNNSSNMEMVKGSMSSENQQRYQDQIKKLKLALQSRDNEITLLLTLINKKRGGNAIQSLPVNRLKPDQEQILKSVVHQKPIQFPEQQRLIKQQQMRQSQIQNSALKVKKNNWMNSTQVSKIQNQSVAKTEKSIDAKEIQSMLVKPLNLSNQDLLDQARAFESFRVSSRRYDAIQKNVDILKNKMKQGKQVAMTVHQARQKIGKLKERFEQLQRQNAVKNLVDGVDRDDPEQEALRQQMVRTKQTYKQASNQLKKLKLEIENINILQKKNTEQLEKDFMKYIQFKRQQREATVSAVDSSILASNVRDKEVQKHLESFLRARQQIRKR